MTYKELLAKLQNLTDEQLGDTVTIFIGDEYYPISHSEVIEETDVLDENHFLLVVE